MEQTRTGALKQAIPYVAPFVVYMGFVALQPVFPVPQWLRLALELVLFATVSQRALTGFPTQPFASAALGVGVFVLWVGPDLLFPGYRHLPLFDNPITGRAVSSLTEVQKHDPGFLIARVLVSVMAVPVLEELFWRGFLLRITSFWMVAVLFASEHGPYWDVGLVAGCVYNWWKLRTGNLFDCILAHSVTNACLAAFVIGGNHWEYWL